MTFFKQFMRGNNLTELYDAFFSDAGTVEKEEVVYEECFQNMDHQFLEIGGVQMVPVKSSFHLP